MNSQSLCDSGASVKCGIGEVIRNGAHSATAIARAKRVMDTSLSTTILWESTGLRSGVSFSLSVSGISAARVISALRPSACR
jgi:F0F1-type ATP synthase beta subunit